MPTSYTKCDASVGKIVNKLVEKYFPDLQECEAKIQCLFADSGTDSDGAPVPAVKVNGYPWPAAVKKNSMKDRVEGKADVTITIDQRRWDAMKPEEQEATLHHELYHLEVKRDDAGQVKTDDIGRPQFNMRLHDWQLGGFRETARLYEVAAAEVREAISFKDEHGQHLFEFAHVG